MDKIYWTIGEAANILSESVSLVRFWSNSFPKLIRPHRNAKGNRLFTASDIETLKQLHFLVREKGLGLESAAKQLSSEKDSVESRVRAIDSLKEIRTRLVDIKKSL